jgi:hypothetical protein
MTRPTILGGAALLVGLAVLAGAARADEEKVPLDKLPKAVVDGVKAKFPKATLKHATKVTEKGKVTYEIGLNLDKQHLHALLTEDGKLFEIHKGIDAKDVPEKVAKAVNAKYPKAKWENIEEMSDADGKVIGYEIAVEANNAIIEIVLSPDGTIRSETKVEPKKEKDK